MVWASFAYRLLISGLATEIALFDINFAKSEWEAMDLEHAMSVEKQTKIYATDYAWMANSDIVVVTAWIPRKPWETRLDMIAKNLDIFKDIIPEISKVCPNSIYIIVSNPVDVMTLATIKYWNLNPKKVIWTWTMLDTMRFKTILWNYFWVTSSDINAFVIWEHWDSQVACFESASISWIPINDFAKSKNIDFSIDTQSQITDDVKNSWIVIISKKMATYYGIASGTMQIVKAIAGDEKIILPVSSLQATNFGEICTSMPTVIWQNGIEKIFNLSLNPKEKLKFDASNKILSEFAKFL